MSIPSTRRSRKPMKIYTTNSDELVSQIPQKKWRKNIRRSTLSKMIQRMSEMFTGKHNKVHIDSTTRKSSPLTRKHTSSLDLDSSLKIDEIRLLGGRTRRRRKGTKHDAKLQNNIYNIVT